MPRRLLPALFLLALSSGNLAGSAAAQPAESLGDGPRVYLGAGVLPGTGAFVGYTAPRLSVFTVEGALYADYTPRVVGGSGRLLAALGVGGGVRALHIAGIVSDFEPGPLDVDLGLRLGPSFYYAFFERTAEEEARSFRVMVEGFARGTLRLGGRVVFVEVGAQAPGLRAGLSFDL